MMALKRDWTHLWKGGYQYWPRELNGTIMFQGRLPLSTSCWGTGESGCFCTLDITLLEASGCPPLQTRKWTSWTFDLVLRVSSDVLNCSSVKPPCAEAAQLVAGWQTVGEVYDIMKHHHMVLENTIWWCSSAAHSTRQQGVFLLWLPGDDIVTRPWKEPPAGSCDEQSWAQKGGGI